MDKLLTLEEAAEKVMVVSDIMGAAKRMGLLDDKYSPKDTEVLFKYICNHFDPEGNL